MPVEKSCRVLIIGAGISGLGAAQKLQENGITDFLVLEATDRIGGRIKTMKRTAGRYNYVLELGAGWIHGITGNPVFQIAKQNKLLVQPKGHKLKTDPRLVTCEKQYRSTDGQEVPRAIYEPVHRAYRRALCEADEIYAKGLPQDIKKDMGLGDFLYKSVMKEIDEPCKDKRKLMEEVLRSRLIFETTISGCHDMNEVSLANIGSYSELNGGHVVLPNGYESVINVVKAKIPKEHILTNHPVIRIEYDMLDDNKCKVYCQNGRTFKAEFVILTASVGFLKENAADLFHPSLSSEKLKAIENIGFGTVDRIYAEFENLNFIPESHVGELYLTKRKEQVTNETEWHGKLFTFYVQNTPRANILTTWISGHQAEMMEQASEDEIKCAIKTVLQKYLGVEVPVPRNIIKTTWHSNPYFRGSYSYVKVGASVRDIQILAEPVVNKSSQKPILLFAGEATEQNFYSTTHGALLSGQREADRILTFMNEI